MVNKYYQKHKENLERQKVKKTKGKKRPKKYIKLLLKKKKKKGVSVLSGT